jgi:hypothetical protein
MNLAIDIHVLERVGHQFGKRQAEAIAHAATWLQATLEA